MKKIYDYVLSILRKFYDYILSVYTIKRNGVNTIQWDKAKHGFVGECVGMVAVATLGYFNDLGSELIFASFTPYVLIYFLSKLAIATLKEVYDKNKKAPTGFDKVDIVATVLPYALCIIYVNLYKRTLYKNK